MGAMAMSHTGKFFTWGILALAGGWLVQNWWVRRNPYAGDGLHAEWHFGATSTVPSLEVWADYRGQRIECPVFFGGISRPDLFFRDFDHDGRRDIVFENDRYKQVVAFRRGRGDAAPEFRVIRNDVWWP